MSITSEEMSQGGEEERSRKTSVTTPLLLSSLFFFSVAVPTLTACAGSEPGADAPSDKGELVGNPAPDFETRAVTGSREVLSLKGLRGQVVLVDFWGTFCDPCKKSFPKLEALRAKYSASGLRIVAISEDEEDDRDKIPAFADSHGAKFPLAWDGDKSIARQYKPETMPSSFLIDRNGVVRFAHVGFRDGEEAELDREIRSLLGN
jgi:cytochrome c biogenesis protein CcmG, thiol:disulfide interchange protein DsbE